MLDAASLSILFLLFKLCLLPLAFLLILQL